MKTHLGDFVSWGLSWVVAIGVATGIAVFAFTSVSAAFGVPL